ncbi:MAG: TRAP transporter large permease [Yaniella sp.]|uniref:TRAP transporter large permease n=1 Tax=Yaniella sp. TaxID=2773929 RepID=UPI002647D329|nr:TRAP transporter large permease [Yaniella sp.]MDN5731805.1 TRAP transporter large permease [Yaniella sp.]MDN5816614.1 TRAP transporter large permease [Yaniella sp.]MDN5818998.1 TRAP transporter large permease [Yaniella sp.]MDN5839328.1 TRAP transporter large permease [Yaniella sp.]MDN5913443.1 TRAP transporter large permease [Yaniella sp.]
MTVGSVIAIVLLLMLVLLLLRVPVAVSLGLSGALGLVALRGINHTTLELGAVPFSETATFSLTIIPMFILMGMFAVRANVAAYVFKIADRVLGRLPGGLGIATVAASAGFSAVSGSSISTAATMARLSVKEMRAAGYPASMATALVAVAGTLGSMIPPSTFLVLYAILAQVSVAEMLAAGIVPGILSAIAYSLWIMFSGWRMRRQEQIVDADNVQDALDQATEINAAKLEKSPLGQLPWRGLVYIGLLFAIVLGGMYSGIFTATESAAFGAIAAVLILLFELRKEGAKGIWDGITNALQNTASTTAMVFFIVIGSGILSSFFIAARVPNMITEAVLSWNIAPSLAMLILLMSLVPLGMVLESLSLLMISVPLLLPVAVEFGFDPIWLGILIVKLIEIGMVTPPVGINAFVVAGTTGIRSETVFKGIMPFFVIDLVLIAIFFLLPDLILYLPSLVQH